MPCFVLLLFFLLSVSCYADHRGEEVTELDQGLSRTALGLEMWSGIARWEETKGGWEGPGGEGNGQAAVKEEVWRGSQSCVLQAGPWNQGRCLVLHWKQLQKG